MGTFRRNAIKVVEEIRSRGRLPILVGGTHYYTQALLFKDAVLDDASIRDAKGIDLEHRWPILNSSTEDMLKELRRVDPLMAARWHPQDRRKIRRSLEIYLTIGKTASEIYELQRKRKTGNVLHERDHNDNNATTEEIETLKLEVEPPLFDPLILWVHADPDVLRTRLDKRVDKMVENGLLSEAASMHFYLQKLESEGTIIDQSCGIWAAIGYKEFKSYLDASHLNTEGQEPLERLKQKGVELTRIATRQYARYQAKWIRLTMQKAVADSHLEKILFLLDGTNMSCWSQDVEAPAAELARIFLGGERLPAPKSLSNVARKLLLTCEKRDRLARHCDICDKTMMSDVEWNLHVKGKKHTSALKPKVDWGALYPKKP